MYQNLSKERCEMVNETLLKEVELDDLELSPIELLAKYDINHDELLTFKSDIDDSTFEGYKHNEDDKGWAINYIHNKKKYTAIFIIKRPNLCGLDLDDDDDDDDLLEYEAITKTITLLHELGHADDFQKAIHLNYENEYLDLIAAEAYADIFALKKLKSLKHPYGRFALKEFSTALLNRKNSSKFYRQVHSLINKKITDSNLRKWSK